MADKITTYTPETAREILRRLDALELRQRSLLGGGYNQSFPQGPLVTRWAKTTTTPTYPTYPSSGNVVGVKFGEYEPSPIYPGATATKTFTAYDPAWYEFATLENGSMPAVDTIVRCTWRDGRWWILQDSSGWPTAFLMGGNSYNSDGSSRNYIKKFQDGYESDDRMGYPFFKYLYGDDAGVGLSVVTDDAAVSGGSSAETSACFALSTTGLYVMHFYLTSYDETSIPDTSSSNITSTSAGTPAHTHDTARLTSHHYHSWMAATIQSRVGAGAWSSLQARNSASLFKASEDTLLYYVTDALSCTFLIANSTAGKEYRIRLALDFRTDSTVDASHRAARAVASDSVSLSISRVGDDPTLTNL